MWAKLYIEIKQSEPPKQKIKQGTYRGNRAHTCNGDTPLSIPRAADVNSPLDFILHWAAHCHLKSEIPTRVPIQPRMNHFWSPAQTSAVLADHAKGSRLLSLRRAALGENSPHRAALL